MMFSTKEMYKSKNQDYIRDLEYQKVSRLGMNVYDTKIDGIKDGLIEWFLWYRGKCMFWKSETLGWVVTDCTELGYAIDGTPNRWKPSLEWDSTGIPLPELTSDECVVFYDCLDWHFKRSDVLIKCCDYSDVHATIRQQVFNQKTPMLGIASNPKLRDKIRNAIMSIRENCSVLILDQSVAEKIDTIDFNAPYNVESLYQYKKSVESEMLEQIGIDYKDAFAKKERLVVDEQEGNDEMLNYLLADGLKARQMAIDKVKAMGFNASTEIQSLVRPIDEQEILGTSNNEPTKTDES